MNETSDYSVGYHYLFCKYVGLGAGVGVWSINSSSGILGTSSDEKEEKQNAFVKPSLLFISPCLFSIKQCDFHIECESGIVISDRQKVMAKLSDMEIYKEYKTDNVSWNCDFCIGMKYKNTILHAYYSVSNLDVNRKYKGNKLNDFTKGLVESVGLKLALLF